jgi:hypothetical protein
MKINPIKDKFGLVVFFALLPLIVFVYPLILLFVEIFYLFIKKQNKL